MATDTSLFVQHVKSLVRLFMPKISKILHADIVLDLYTQAA